MSSLMEGILPVVVLILTVLQSQLQPSLRLI